MFSTLLLSGDGFRDLAESLRSAFKTVRPDAVGVVSAFVSVSGVERLAKLLPSSVDVRLVAGTSLAFTHPNALAIAQNKKWNVRLATNRVGVFHPKLIIGGAAFLSKGGVDDPALLYVGSANLTDPALTVNTECGALYSGSVPADASSVFAQLWAQGKVLTPSLLESYADAFSQRNKARRAEDLREFGVSESDGPDKVTSLNLKKQRKARHVALQQGDAHTVWVGLESSTGGYSFQPEFPRAVGELVRRLLQRQRIPLKSIGSGSTRREVAEVKVRCSDAEVREMTFTYYHHNSMWRLNVPLDVPNAEVASTRKEGVAVLSQYGQRGAALSLEILLPGKSADEIVRRSYVLGTWSTTSTRCYGWF